MTFKEILQNTKKSLEKKNEEKKEKEIGFDAWIQDLEEEEQPEACSIDNPDCENCGS